MAAPNYSSNHSPEEDDKLKQLLTIVEEQNNALISLQEITTQLTATLTDAMQSSLSSQINIFTQNQNDRFNRIDALINENILNIKKGKTSSNQVFVFGKEIRKIEAAIRTIKLFLCDVINMLSPSGEGTARMHDRLHYATNRLQQTKQELNEVEQAIKVKEL